MTIPRDKAEERRFYNESFSQGMRDAGLRRYRPEVSTDNLGYDNGYRSVSKIPLMKDLTSGIPLKPVSNLPMQPPKIIIPSDFNPFKKKF
jgi:hypothetical protein